MAVDPLHEFEDGVAFWATLPRWPQDLHNAFYENQHVITDGTFGDDWWILTRAKLQAWRATRGASYADLDRRFRLHRAELAMIWQSAIQRRLSGDITTVTWDHVRALPELARLIKPTRDNSGVFASKLSHFIAPRLFPVLDRTALPRGQPDYASYFDLVGTTWSDTDPADQQALRERLTTLVERRSGGPIFSGYPIVNKIVELRLIGRRFRSTH